MDDSKLLQESNLTASSHAGHHVTLYNYLTLPLPSKWRTSQPNMIPRVCVSYELGSSTLTHQMFPTILRVPKQITSSYCQSWSLT